MERSRLLSRAMVVRGEVLSSKDLRRMMNGLLYKICVLEMG